jgi:uncharacterized membrane protein
MSDQNLERLEHQITRVLRIGVLISAIALGAGLLCGFAGEAIAIKLFVVGLVTLMAIPITRIAASLVDAIRRRDTLLVWSTAIVLVVMAITLLHSLRSQ